MLVGLTDLRSLSLDNFSPTDEHLQKSYDLAFVGESTPS